MIAHIELQKREVVRLVESMRKSWNKHDAKAYADCFAEHAEFTTVFGNVNNGRRTIEEGHAIVFEKLFKNSSLTIDNISVRSFKADVASVHFTWIIAALPNRMGQHGKNEKVQWPELQYIKTTMGNSYSA